MDINLLKRNINKIEEILLSHFETELNYDASLSSFLIFPDGKLVGGYRHRDMMDYLYDERLLDDEDIKKYDTDIFNEVFDCIRCSRYTENENYVGLPEANLTSAQYKTLEKWIDNNIAIGRKKLQVTTRFGFDDHQTVFYDYDSLMENGWPTKYIIQRIKQYYSTGKLNEDLEVTTMEPNKLEPLTPEKIPSYMSQYFKSYKSYLIFKLSKKQGLNIVEKIIKILEDNLGRGNYIEFEFNRFIRNLKSVIRLYNSSFEIYFCKYKDDEPEYNYCLNIVKDGGIPPLFDSDNLQYAYTEIYNKINQEVFEPLIVEGANYILKEALQIDTMAREVGDWDRRFISPYRNKENTEEWITDNFDKEIFQVAEWRPQDAAYNHADSDLDFYTAYDKFIEKIPLVQNHTLRTIELRALTNPTRDGLYSTLLSVYNEGNHQYPKFIFEDSVNEDLEVDTMDAHDWDRRYIDGEGYVADNIEEDIEKYYSEDKWIVAVHPKRRYAAYEYCDHFGYYTFPVAYSKFLEFVDKVLADDTYDYVSVVLINAGGKTTALYMSKTVNNPNLHEDLEAEPMSGKLNYYFYDSPDNGLIFINNPEHREKIADIIRRERPTESLYLDDPECKLVMDNKYNNPNSVAIHFITKEVSRISPSVYIPVPQELIDDIKMCSDSITNWKKDGDVKEALQVDTMHTEGQRFPDKEDENGDVSDAFYILSLDDARYIDDKYVIDDIDNLISEYDLDRLKFYLKISDDDGTADGCPKSCEYWLSVEKDNDTVVAEYFLDIFITEALENDTERARQENIDIYNRVKEIHDYLHLDKVHGVYKYTPENSEGLRPFNSVNLEDTLQEKIVKKGSKWQVQSEKGKNLGTYNTKKEAKKRLQQVHYFKHTNEALQVDNMEMPEIDKRFILNKYQEQYLYKYLDEENWEVLAWTDKLEGCKYRINNLDFVSAYKIFMNRIEEYPYIELRYNNFGDVDDDESGIHTIMMYSEWGKFPKHLFNETNEDLQADTQSFTIDDIDARYFRKYPDKETREFLINKYLKSPAWEVIAWVPNEMFAEFSTMYDDIRNDASSASLDNLLDFPTAYSTFLELITKNKYRTIALRYRGEKDTHCTTFLEWNSGQGVSEEE